MTLAPASLADAVWDVAIVGAGIAGASLAWELAQAGVGVLLLEREAQPGYHSTGRSAALYLQTYGTPAIRALTRASHAFYDTPPPGFADSPLLTPRGVVYVAQPDQLAQLEATHAALRAEAPLLRPLTHAELLAELPLLRPQAVAAGLWEGGGADIDVHALHQGYLRGLRRRAGVLRADAEVLALARTQGAWAITLAGGERVRARQLVNAAGAWADALALQAGAAPVGLVPKRRTAFTFAPPEGADIAHWPAAMAVDESWYFKPDAGQLLGSPANADPTSAHDVQPEEIDIATGIWRIEQVTTLRIRRPTRAWAGLRSFVADGDFVVGWDARVEGFFWLAAQGGYGIQSAAGTARLARALLLAEPLDATLTRQGVDAARLAPARQLTPKERAL